MTDPLAVMMLRMDTDGIRNSLSTIYVYPKVTHFVLGRYNTADAPENL